MPEELWTLEGDLLSLGVTAVLFDRHRHLIVEPYSLERLHAAAQVLGIKRCWFHRDHYDIPKRRVAQFLDVAEPDTFWSLVNGRRILQGIKKGGGR